MSRILPAVRIMVLAAGLVWPSLPAQAQAQAQAQALGPARPVFAIKPSNVLAISSPDNHCKVESHRKAIDPKVIECHAAFAPVPMIPPLLKDTTPGQRDAAGRWLVSQLNQPGVCGKGEKISPNKSCAVLIYVLRESDRKTDIPVAQATPWVYVINIYRISHTRDEADTTLFTINSNASEGEFGPGSNPVWELLAEQRAARRCIEGKSQFVGGSVTASGMKDDHCRTLKSDDWRYYPMLLLPHSKASVVLNKSLVRSVFYAPTYIVNDIAGAQAAVAAVPK